MRLNFNQKDGGERLNPTAFDEGLLEVKEANLAGGTPAGVAKGDRKLIDTTMLELNPGDSHLPRLRSVFGERRDTSLPSSGRASCTCGATAVDLRTHQ